MRLLDSDVQNREVAAWKGLHLLHFGQSSCSQKLRIFMDIKGIAWTPHHVDLMKNENLNAWFLGINPRGLVPVLVHDGVVHIESNDILVYLEELYPTPQLIPAGAASKIEALLKHEDDLHFDLRNLSFRFVFAPPESPKSADDLVVYANAGSGLVQGEKDAGLADQIDYWKRYAAAGGIPDDVARASAQKFRAAFAGLDDRLSAHPFLFGDSLTLVDIAWFIYVNRLMLAGYPVGRLHPRLAAWFERLCELPPFARERQVSMDLKSHAADVHRAQASAGTSLEHVAAL